LNAESIVRLLYGRIVKASQAQRPGNSPNSVVLAKHDERFGDSPPRQSLVWKGDLNEAAGAADTASMRGYEQQWLR